MMGYHFYRGKGQVAVPSSRVSCVLLYTYLPMGEFVE